MPGKPKAHGPGSWFPKIDKIGPRGLGLTLVCLALGVLAPSLGQELGAWAYYFGSILPAATYASLNALSLCALILLACLAESAGRAARLSRAWALAALACLELGLQLLSPPSASSSLGLCLRLIIPLCLYCPPYRALGFSGLALGLAYAYRYAWAGGPGFYGADSEMERLYYLCLPLILGPFTLLLGRMVRECGRLREALLKSTKLAMSYQDYSREVEERSAFNERQRLTRDIHDVVGYSLTTTIMMMEAAKIMSQRESDKVPGLIDQARENAKDALESVRSTLRALRRQDMESVGGLGRILKAKQVFSLATGVDVELDFGNYNWNSPPPVSLAIIHFIQEAMVNAYSHGAASRIFVYFWRGAEGLSVTVRDNGRGAAGGLVEGIGLAGMRERVEALGGQLEYGNIVDGFKAKIVIPGEGHGQDDQFAFGG